VAQHTGGVAQIADEIFDKSNAARVSAFLFVQRDWADEALGREPRLLRRHADTDVGRDLLLQVIAELAVEIGLRIPAEKNRA
jgi:hypothetical protein